MSEVLSSPLVIAQTSLKIVRVPIKSKGYEKKERKKILAKYFLILCDIV